jgi:PAS domain S-box-containing protein
MKDKQTSGSWRTAWECLLASVALAVLTYVSFRLHAGPAMAALLFFLLVVLISLWAGFLSTAFACAVAALCFVYFFTQPLYHLWMSEPVEIAATIAFSSTALIISRLLARVRARTAEVHQTNEQLQAEIAERRRAEEKIRQSEAELQQLIDAIPQQVFVFDANWNPLFANRREREYTGLTPEEAQSKDAVAKIFHPDDLKRLEVLRERAVREAAPFEMEARIRDKEGQYRWFLIRDNPLRDEQGRILRWYGTRTDIEDRKRAEEALRESETYLAESQRLTHTGSWALDLASDRYVYVSEEDLRLWGFDPQMGLPSREAVFRRIHPEDRGKMRASFEKSLREKVDSSDEYRIVLPDGTVKHVHTIRHLVLNGAGDVVKLVGTSVDITERKRAEEALRESETRFRTFVDHAPDALFIFDFEQGTIVDVNRQACESLGYTRQELIGTTPLAFDQNVDRAVTESIAERTAAGETVIDTHWHQRKDGTQFPVEVHTSQYWYGGRRFLLKVARDITDRLRAEEERAYLASIVESSDDAIIGRSMEGIIQSWNRGAERLYGYTAQEAIGQPITMLIPPDRAREFVSSDRLKQGEWIEEQETVRVGKDGRRIDVSVIISPMKDAAGRVLGAATVARDITERKRAQEALRRSEAYLAEGQRLGHAGSFAWSAATLQSMYWSEEMFRIFGLNPQEGVPSAETFWQRIHPEDLDRTRELLLKAALGNMEYEHDHRIVLPDGTVKHIHAIGHPVLGENGQVAEYVGTAVDVTDRKRAEEERERLRQLEADLAHIDRVSMMGELAASIAHEVNQPLSGVVVNANACLRWMAGDSPNLNEAREAVRRIVRDGKRAGDVIARVRALVTKTATTKERLNMNEALREVIALAGDELRKNRVAVRTEFAPDLLPVLGDRVQLQQVVLNLVMNGIEAMSSVEERPRELMVKTQNDDAGQVRVTVQDSGMGLDPQSMERMFDAFYTTKQGGMGMGLSISRSIIQNHGGKLWAVANDGPGISVQFTIPKYQP